MRFPSSGTLVLIAFAILTASGTIIVSPSGITEPRLGANWQCSQIALLLTSCSQRARLAETASRTRITEAPARDIAALGR